MSFATRSGVLASLTATGLAAGLSLTACATPAGPERVDARVLVHLVQPSADAAAISATAARQAGVPVTYAAAASPAWHALALHCDSRAQCEAAVERLRSAGSIYASVELEGRRQKTTP
jgi:hypothetical protein